MKKSFARRDAERLLPLLRSIGREIRDRSRVIDAQEERLAALSETRDEHRLEIAQIESELSLNRRELRRIERELAELGCDLDADHPLRILIPGRGETFAWERQLDRTQFYRKASAKA
jgi:septal ring factor EnvC (AmiA/AmiB activator)